ncbi:MAG TPA: Hsp20/alpha crystallin family protein [Candidatus Binatia bacterium]|jgi:HSP20 family protein|nr:Hsp20/alpha crystallin family protein [Candidatus Binatia bacterium]
MLLMSNPFNDLLRLQAELDNLHKRPAPGYQLGTSSAGVFPPINVFRNADGVVVRAELAGLRPEDITVTSERRRLTISGERKPDEGERGAYHRRERSHGRFSRTVVLPDDLDAEHANAQFRDGVMTITIPLVAAAKPRTITVKAA